MHLAINKTLIVVLVSFIAAITNSTLAQARITAPVSFEAIVPVGLEAGDEVTTTVRIIAGSDMQHMVISAAAYNGLTVVSGGEQQVITNVSKGDTFDIKVSIRLDEEIGYLAVLAATTDAQGRTINKNTAIRYGQPGVTTMQKLSSNNLTIGSNGETLILMPAETR